MNENTDIFVHHIELIEPLFNVSSHKLDEAVNALVNEHPELEVKAFARKFEGRWLIWVCLG